MKDTSEVKIPENELGLENVLRNCRRFVKCAVLKEVHQLFLENEP
jgi:hypothetical protein